MSGHWCGSRACVSCRRTRGRLACDDLLAGLGAGGPVSLLDRHDEVGKVVKLVAEFVGRMREFFSDGSPEWDDACDQACRRALERANELSEE